MKEILGTRRCFIQGVLVQVAEAEAMKMEDAGLSKLVEGLGGLVNTRHQHIGCYNEMCNRHLAMLGWDPEHWVRTLPPRINIRACACEKLRLEMHFGNISIHIRRIQPSEEDSS